MYKDVSKIIQLLLGYRFKYKTFFKKIKNTLTTDRIKFKIFFLFYVISYFTVKRFSGFEPFLAF